MNFKFSCYYCEAEGEMDIIHDDDKIEISYCPVCGADISDSVKEAHSDDSEEE